MGLWLGLGIVQVNKHLAIIFKIGPIIILHSKFNCSAFLDISYILYLISFQVVHFLFAHLPSIMKAIQFTNRKSNGL